MQGAPKVPKHAMACLWPYLTGGTGGVGSALPLAPRLLSPTREQLRVFVRAKVSIFAQTIWFSGALSPILSSSPDTDWPPTSAILKNGAYMHIYGHTAYGHSTG